MSDELNLVVGEDATELFQNLSPEVDPTDIAVKHIIDTIPNEADQIDAIATERRWFRPNDDSATNEGIKSYMAGTLDLESLVQIITTPIDLAYTSANNGQAIIYGEEVAASQRQYWSAEEAREQWGDPLPEDELPARLDNPGPTVEGSLWDLWYSVLHAAKKTPWRDTAAQEKLLALVRALKAHPDPAPPAKMTVALQHDWIWCSGVVWSDLLMIGPATRESWNDCPGTNTGNSIPEIHAWANVNAFVAKLTATGLAEFWLYAIWAMRPALEYKYKPSTPSPGEVPEPTELDVHLTTAAAWAIVLGKELWEREEDLTPKSENEGDPAGGGDLWKGKAEFSKSRYEFWAKRFRELGGDERLLPETIEAAKEAANIMKGIMQS